MEQKRRNHFVWDSGDVEVMPSDDADLACAALLRKLTGKATVKTADADDTLPDAEQPNAHSHP